MGGGGGAGWFGALTHCYMRTVRGSYVDDAQEVTFFKGRFVHSERGEVKLDSSTV